MFAVGARSVVSVAVAVFLGVTSADEDGAGRRPALPLGRGGFELVLLAARAEEAGAVEHLLLEILQIQVNGRRDVQRDELRDDQSADDDQSQRAAARAVGTETE